MNKKYDVIIIGAGLSGLLSGVYLSNKGLRVCLLDKNKKTGGMIQPFKREGFYFETGMNFFGAAKKKQIQNSLFKIFGINDEFKVSEIEYFEYYFENNKYIIPNNFEKFEKQFCIYFPEEKEGIQKFIKTINGTLSKLTLENIGNNHVFFSEMSLSAEDFINSCISDVKLRQILKFNGLLFGSDFKIIPYYIYALITGTYMSSTVVFENGTFQFIKLLEDKIKESSGQILTKKKVTEIKTDVNQVLSVKCSDNTEYYADYYISTIHPQTLFPLITSSKITKYYRKRISELKNTSAIFIINVLLKDKSVLYDKIPKIFQIENEQILIYFPITGKNGKFARTAKIMVKDEYEFYDKFSKFKIGHRGDEYEKLKEKKVKQTIEIINLFFPDFYKKIEKIYTSSPLTFEHYTGSPQGSSYGIEKNFLKPEQTIFPVYTKFNNLFLSGQSINFHGLTGVSVTVFLSCNVILALKGA